MRKAFEKGEDMDLADVMIQAQKASLSFQAMTQVRNKLLEAYRDIKNMPI
jgi:flagellar hook-basal body complex protein FliE